MKISICIPTYNRAEFLAKLLDSIICQSIDYSVEICISDNASTDHTESLIAEYKEKYPNIVYFRWQENMGADLNYIKCVEIASGDYCWLMGSDDVLLENSLAYIKGLIDIAAEDIILFAQRDNYDFHLKKLLGVDDFITQTPEKVTYDLHNDHAFFNYCLKAKSLSAFFSYLSCIVVNRKVWSAQVYSRSVIGGAYVHAFIIFSMIKNNHSKLNVIKRSVVKNRTGQDSFNHNDYAIRLLLDLKGYDQIITNLFGRNSIQYKAMLYVLDKDHSFYAFKRAIGIATRSNETSLRMLQSYLIDMRGCGIKYYPLMRLMNRKVLRSIINASWYLVKKLKF